MSDLRRYKRGLRADKTKVAAIMTRLQRIEPDARKLRANFAEVFEEAMTQKTIEVFEPKSPEQV